MGYTGHQKSRFSIMVLAILLLVCITPGLSVAQDEWTKYQGTGFTLNIPDHFTVEKTTPVRDFDLFRFYNKEKKQILGAYAGNFSQFPDRVPEDVPIIEGTLGGKPAKMAEWKDSEGLYHGDILIMLHSADEPGYPFPMEIHLWYLELYEEELALVKRIV